MISARSIDDVRQIDIVDVIRRRVDLKKRGANYQACCPFHDEKSPSFSVTPSKGIFKCFGCGAAGDSIEFVMKYDRVEFADAVKIIAEEFNLNLEYDEDEKSPEQRKEEKDRKELILKVLEWACTQFEAALQNNEEALNYLQHIRGYSMDIIKSWRLGWAPEEWRFLADKMVNGGKLELGIEAGLLVRKDDRHYDFFRGRIMIPICDKKGRVISFGGRLLTDEKPKYLNGPNTIVFNKEEALFGIHKAKDAIVKRDSAMLFEGYFDVISSHSSGYENAVAKLGTSFTRHHAVQLRKLSRNLILGADNDDAGAKSMLPMLKIALSEKLMVKALVLPERCKDIDQFLKGTGDA